MITVKEEFVGCDKYATAMTIGGSDAIVMWLAMKRYAASNLSDGFVPDEKIDTLPGAPKRPRKALKALVDCGELAADGSRGAGLVDTANLGWQLHDYDDHANTADDERLRKEKARVKKAAQRAAKRAELERLCSGNGGRSRGHTGDGPGDTRGTVPGTSAEGHSGARPRSHVRTRAPSPAQPNLSENQPPPKDLTGQADGSQSTAAADFSNFSIGEKAMLVLEDERLAITLQPHTWPELLELIGVACGAVQREQRVLPYDSDPTVQAFVVLLARFNLPRLREVLPGTLNTDFWKQVPQRPLSHLTPAVVDRYIADDVEIARLQARRQQDLQRSVVPRKAAPAPLSAAETLAALAGAEAALNAQPGGGAA